MAINKSIEVSAARSTLNLLDELTQKLTQLDSMLALTYGEGGASFRNYNDGVQDNYLWACSTFTRDVKELADRIAEQAYAESNP